MPLDEAASCRSASARERSDGDVAVMSQRNSTWQFQQCSEGRADGFRDETRRASEARQHLVIPPPRPHAAGSRARGRHAALVHPAVRFRARRRPCELSAGADSRLPAIACNVAGGTSSEAHLLPQCQHAPSWRAIGAWQARHKRGKWRWRMAQRSFPSTDRRSRDLRLNRRTALPSLRGGTVNQVTDRHEAGR